MSQDIVADALNKMVNSLKAGKNSVEIQQHSKLLLAILAIAKLRGYIINYQLEGNLLKVQLGNLNDCKAIKPRYIVSVKNIDKYVKRYLPAREIGVIIISTSQGLMTHQTAIDKNLGGSLIAYLY